MSRHRNSLPMKISSSFGRRYCLLVFLFGIFLLSGCDTVTSITSKIGSMIPTETENPETVGPKVPEEKFTINHLDLGVSSIYGTISLDPDEKDFDEEYAPAVIMMQDATNFIMHDRSIVSPASAQELGYITLNDENSHFTLMLPTRPNGIFHDLDNDAEEDQGVQVYFISMEYQHGGSPYFDNDQDWSSYFSSIVFEDQAATKIQNGYFLVWAADEKQEFPSGFGDDGILFTEDDPMKAVKQGYTVIFMGKSTFSFMRSKEVEVVLSQGESTVNRKLSDLSYAESFSALFDDMKGNYAFVGIPEKEPDWDSLYVEYFPEIQQAEEDDDYEIFYSTLKSFAGEFSDSHVSVFQLNIETREARDYQFGYGFMVEELPGGEIIVSYIDDYSSLYEKGVQLGDQLVTIAGQDINAFLAENAAAYGAYSREEVRRADQLADITRDEYDEHKNFGFKISDGSILTINQRAYSDNDTYSYGYEGSSRYYWPVEYAALDSGYGYVAITSNMGGEDFTRNMFENALDDLQNQGVKGIIIDLRYNYGGEMLKLVEYFLDEPVKIANLEYPGSADIDGNALKYEIWAHPYIRQYKFDDVAVLIGSDCVSACEVEAYAFSKLPGVKMIGSQPTAGAVALISGESYDLPEDIEFNYSIGRFIDDEGEIFLEGKGVSPDIVIPESRGTVSTPYDWLMVYADSYLQYQDVMTYDAAYNPQAKNVDINSYIEMLKNESQIDLDTSSIEMFPGTMVPGNTYTYHTFLDTSEDIFAGKVTCTSDTYNYENFFNAINVHFTVNGEDVKDDYVVSETAAILGTICRIDLLMLSDWSEGMNEVIIEVTYDRQVYDGMRWLPEGTYNMVYEIAAKDFSE